MRFLSTSKRALNTGFTIVEVMVVAPIVILMIGGFITAIITTTGRVLAARAENTLIYNIQDALDTIEQDVRLSSGFLATNSVTLTSPQGINNGTTAFKNSSTTYGNILILQGTATNKNPSDPTRALIYMKDAPNACSSSQVAQNQILTYNTVYFIKDNTLWRRILSPANYASIGCNSQKPWQVPTCAPSITGSFCVTEDTRLVTGVELADFTLNYYATAQSTTSQSAAISSSNTDTVRQTALSTTNTVSVELKANQTVAGRDISASGTVRSTRIGNGDE